MHYHAPIRRPVPESWNVEPSDVAKNKSNLIYQPDDRQYSKLEEKLNDELGIRKYPVTHEYIDENFSIIALRNVNTPSMSSYVLNIP
jgi:hypothetical protein